MAKKKPAKEKRALAARPPAAPADAPRAINTSALMAKLTHQTRQESLIPLGDKPIIGADLDAIRSAMGLPVDDAKYLFGISGNRWNLYKRHRKYMSVPLAKPALALLVRYLNKNPDKSIIPTYPTATELHTLVGGHMKTLSVLMGMEGAAGYRWIKRSKHMSPSVRRLSYFLKLELQAGRFDEWREMVETEARARGVTDIFQSGAWTTPESRTKTKVRRPGVQYGRPPNPNKKPKKASAGE